MNFFLLAFGCLASLTLISGKQLTLKQAWSHFTNKQCADWSISPHPLDCHKFYACVNSITEVYTCAPNYHFDKLEGRCVVGPCVTDNEPKCRANTLERVDGDCKAYKVCLNGTYAQHYCPSDYYFDALYGICLPIANTPQHKCSCFLPEFAVLVNEEDCESYFVCSNGIPVLKKCPRGQYYDDRVNVCLPDMKGVCLEAPTMNPRELAMLSVCEEASKKGEIFVGSTSSDCREFHMCVNGRVFTKQCQEGFYFDKENNYCVVDTDGKCKQQQQEATQATTKHHYYQGFKSTTVTTPEPSPLPQKKPTKRPGWLNWASQFKKKKEAAKLTEKIPEAPVAPVIEHEVKHQESIEASLVELPLAALHHQQLPSATKSQYDKLSSKFLTF